MRPHPGVAVGLQLEPHPVGLRTGLRAVRGLHHPGQVLDVVAVLVGDHVHLRELPAVGPVLGGQRVEEGHVDVEGHVGRAVEGADVGGRRAAAGLHLVLEDMALCLDEVDALGGGELPPRGVRGLHGRLDQAVVALVGVGAGEAVVQRAALGRRPLLRAAAAAEQVQRVAADQRVDQDHHEQQAAGAAAELEPAAAPPAAARGEAAPAATSGGDVVGADLRVRIEGHAHRVDRESAVNSRNSVRGGPGQGAGGPGRAPGAGT